MCAGALIAVGSLPPDLGVRDTIIWLADGVVAEDLIRPDVDLDRIRKMMTAPIIAGVMTCIGGVTRDSSSSPSTPCSPGCGRTEKSGGPGPRARIRRSVYGDDSHISRSVGARVPDLQSVQFELRCAFDTDRMPMTYPIPLPRRRHESIEAGARAC
jgi:hypothetical protein